MSLVVPCGTQADCYIYTVRYTARGPDRLANIANFFGVDIKKIWQLNPSLNGGTAIHTGQKLRIPSPTK
jgi:LysM repeat protein